MGVMDFFSPRISFTGPRLRWNEPYMFEARLYHYAARKLFIAAAGFSIAITFFLVLYSTSDNPTLTLPIALFLGTVFGSLVALIVIGRDLAGGFIVVDKKGIHRTRASVLFLMQHYSLEDWPYEAIQQCRIVPLKNQKQSFSILEVYTDDDCDLLGLPESLNTNQLLKLLQSNGVPVSIAPGFVPKGSLLENPPRQSIVTRILIPIIIVCGLIVAAMTFRSETQDSKKEVIRAAETIPRPNIPRDFKPPLLNPHSHE